MVTIGRRNSIHRERCRNGVVRQDGRLAVALSNSRISIDMLPELGGKIWRRWDRSQSIEWIWHNPHRLR
jgi:hypothetical protein